MLVERQAYPVTVGRYVLFDPIASGGMASVHIGRLLGSFGFARTVAIKRLHQNMAVDPEFLAMFLEEARLAARIRHTNVVQTVDVVALENELLLVMEYVSGAALSRILSQERRSGRATPHRIAVDIMVGVLNGLHAAHEAKNENGEPLHIVHRDVSPQNILIGTDGVARVLDFGIAKAVGGTRFTRPNQIKGKLRYISPESVTAQSVTRASDVYSASVVLWEMLTGRRLFEGENGREIVQQVLSSSLVAPSHVRPHISRKLDEIVMCGLSRDPAARHATARDMALALESAVTAVSRSAVSEWAVSSVGEEIRERDGRVAQIEREAQPDLTAETRFQPDRGTAVNKLPLEELAVTQPNEPGTAPSISMLIEHPMRARVLVKRRRFWALSLVGFASACVVVGAAWLRSKPSQHDTRFTAPGSAAAAPRLGRSSALPAPPADTVRASISSLTAAPIPADAPPVEGRTNARSERLSKTPATSSKHPPVRRLVAPKTPVPNDRIYRRD